VRIFEEKGATIFLPQALALTEALVA